MWHSQGFYLRDFSLKDEHLIAVVSSNSAQISSGKKQ